MLELRHNTQLLRHRKNPGCRGHDLFLSQLVCPPTCCQGCDDYVIGNTQGHLSPQQSGVRVAKEEGGLWNKLPHSTTKHHSARFMLLVPEQSLVTKAPMFILGLSAVAQASCQALLPQPTKIVREDLGKWEIGERYGTSMMQAFNNWVVGWTDWNMAINEQGGPATFDYNAAIIVNATADEFYKQPPYYFQAHFSMFVPPDSQHVSLTSENDGGLLNVAFLTPGNDVVVVLMNSQNVSVSVLISDPDRGHISVGVEARSINTIIYR
uniref:Glucosylceramidase n=1 Tax=Timema monikensis TaxID=170555 RepID=A0A7R9HTY9_9NEOP|nr:unnamed protein product [Timema monikensis]